MLTVDIDDHMEPKSICRDEVTDEWQDGYSGESTFCYDIWGDGIVQLNPLYPQNSQNLAWDDGNLEDGDGCSQYCNVQDGYAWSIEANGKSYWQKACGNGEVSLPEKWDDGNEVNGDGWDENWEEETDYVWTNDPGQPSVCSHLEEMESEIQPSNNNEMTLIQWT